MRVDSMSAPNPEIEAALAEGARLSAARRYEEALAVYRWVLERDPVNIQALKALAATMRALGRPAEAFEAWQQILALAPRTPSGYLQQGHTLLEMKQYQEAVVRYERALQLDPNRTEALIGLGQALEGLHRPEE